MHTLKISRNKENFNFAWYTFTMINCPWNPWSRSLNIKNIDLNLPPFSFACGSMPSSTALEEYFFVFALLLRFLSTFCVTMAFSWLASVVAGCWCCAFKAFKEQTITALSSITSYNNKFKAASCVPILFQFVCKIITKTLLYSSRSMWLIAYRHDGENCWHWKINLCITCFESNAFSRTDQPIKSTPFSSNTNTTKENYCHSVFLKA